MKAKLNHEKFAVVKTDEIPEDFFAIVKLSEITAVVPESAIADLRVKEAEYGFRLITFDVDSSYHTDHILIVERAIETLRNIGFVVEEG